MGAVSAATLNLTETGLASEGVKNYTEAHNKIPGYVDLAGKNSSASSFLKILTKTTVQLNSNSTAPVNISSVNNPTGPSGSATGTLYKSDYITVANNVYNYINTNGRAPNYASSTLGNIRYEALIYAYARIVNFYHYNGRLPDYVTINNIVGVDSTGVVIDTIAPTVTDNLATGIYNSTKNVTLTAIDHVDARPKVYYSTDNGVTWITQINMVILTLNQGVTVLKYYGLDAAGNRGATQIRTYTIDTTAPTATVNIPGGVYNTTKSITLTATDNFDTNPKMFYSLNNGTTWNNQVNNVTLNIGQGVTVLQYYSLDAAGNQGVTGTETYTIDTIVPNVSESDPVNGEVNVPEDVIITITFNKPVQAGNILIELNNSSGTEIPITTDIIDNVLTITPGTFLIADIYTITLHTGSILDLAGNPLGIWMMNFNTTGLFTADDIAEAANIVKSYIEANHTLPNNVTISGTQVTMPQFLRLATEAMLNINNNSTAFIPIGSYNTAPNPSENITSQDINKTEYLDIADSVKTYMDTNGRAPNYATVNSTGSTIQYESLVYTYAKILNNYNVTGNLPDYITVNPWGSLPNSNIIGNTTYGYVEKYVYGNTNSSQTIALIVGVHPQENGIHTAIVNSLINKSGNLAKRYILYYIHVTQNADNYNIGRMNGQLLAQQFIVPDVASENPLLVLDNHENHGADSGYTYYRFLYPISNTTITSTYCNEIIDQIPFLVMYYPPNPTSPEYVTLPIADQGITTIIYETYFYDSLNKKASDANAIINALDILGDEENSNPTLTADPTGSLFNTSKTISLTLSDPESTATIYYTTDGSNPQTSSTKIEYTSPIVINRTTTLKFSALDSGNWSPIFSETYTLDLSAPIVKSVDPTNGALQVPSTKIIKVTFNEPVKAGSLWIELKNNSGIAIPFTTIISSNILTITPTKALTENRYILTLHTNSVTDLAGNSFALWGISFNTTNAFTLNALKDAAKNVKKYVETNHNLPSSVTISGRQVSMPQFLKLSGEAILNISGTLKTSFILGSYAGAPKPSETLKTGIMNSTEYKKIVKRVNTFMNSNRRAPNYASSSLGNIRYQSLIYMYSEILDSYNINGVLPDFIIVDPWSVVKNSNTVFYSADQVNDAAGRVKSFTETNHRLPSYVTISGKHVSMSSYLKLAVTNLLNIGGSFSSSIVLQDCDEFTDPEETITSKNMGYSEYFKIASNVRTFMDDDIFGRAPNYATTSLGKMRFESLVYMYSKILDYYNSTDYLPENITVTPWSVVSSSNTVFITADQINNAAGTVKSYVEVNHRLPNSVTIGGKQVTMPQFLQLSTEALLSIEGKICTSFIPRNYDTAPSPSESITKINIEYTEYLEFANRINSFMDSNGRAPNYINQNSTGDTIRYESIVYMYAQILNSYKNSNETLPDYVTVTPWSVVSTSNTTFFTVDQITSAAGTLKSYIESNHMLPSSITISGKQVSMPQFLQLSSRTLLNIVDDLNTSVILQSVGNASNPVEDISSGDILYDEYLYIAQNVQNYIDTNETVPNYAYQTSLGNHMSFKSLVYMYAQILHSYSSNNEILPDYVTLTPWIAVSNPGAIYNYQTGKVFNSIQAAIDDIDTHGGEFIGIGVETVTENVIVNKKLTIMPIPTLDVTVQAADPNLPVFTITTYGSGSILIDLIIKGATNSAGIFINNSYYSTISGDTIFDNDNGIFILNSTNNQVADSEILNNNMNGILIDTGSDNKIIGNKVTGNGQNGISISNSNNNILSNNIIVNNNMDGIYLNNSSTQINFNKITGNSRYGLYNTGNGMVNAQNNWWGSNNPIISSTSPSDICINGGTVTCDKWLMLNVTGSTDRSDRSGDNYNYVITADVTHNNQGEDTSSGNSNIPLNLPDGIPLNFTTTFGTINTTISTKNGKSVATLNSTTAGSTNVTITLDNQSLTIPVNIVNVNTLGVYNTRTGEYFSTVQSAIDDNNTLDGDTITLADGTYTENVIVHKKITIKSVTGANVIVKAADSNNNVFTIVENGSTIQNLTVIGSSDSYGIFIYGDYTNIIGNVISANYYGISLFNSNYNIISGNTITNNWYGINFLNSNSSVISENNIKDNWYGIYFYNSTSIGISGNNITGNWYGITLSDSNSVTIYENSIINNYCGIYLSNSNSTTISGNIITDNSGGISYYNSNSTIISGNTITDNEIADISQIDTSGVVIQSNIWNCGPASLATVLKNLGVNITQEEIADLAGTDKKGTTMYGLFHTAQIKGLNAVGVILSIDQLKPNYIVLLNINGLYHFSVIKSINSTTIYLADSAFGNINMPLKNFTGIYSGYTLIVKTKNSTTTNGTILTNEQMETIKGTNINISGFGGIISEFGGVALGTLARVVLGPVGLLITLATLPTVGGQNEMYYINRYNQQHSSNQSPTYTTYYTGYRWIPGGGYVSYTGYVSSVISLVDLEYQRDCEKYKDEKVSNWNKIYNTIKANQKQDSFNNNRILNKDIKNYLEWVTPAPKDGDEGTFLLNLLKWSKNKINKGIREMNDGNYIKGASDITLGTGGINIWGSFVISKIWPDGLWPKNK